MADLDLDEIKKKKFNISIENLITIGMVVVTVVGMWYSLQADIQLAKELPEPPVTRTEYDLKDQLIRETIINTQEKVDEIDKTVKKIDDKLFEIIKD
jgi:hypothetical protein